MSTVTPDLATAGAPERNPASSPGLWLSIKKLLKPIASLQLTVTLFALSMVLVFFGTVAQKNQGIWAVVDQYFWSWIVMIDLQLGVDFGKIFFSLPTDMQLPSWMKIPFPGGKLIGGLMFANLIAAHLIRFKLSWKRAGIITLHLGMLLMFVGEYITREYQVEQQMHIAEGGATDFAFDTRNYELAFVTPSVTDPNSDDVTVIPATMLRTAFGNRSRISSPELPVDLEVNEYFKNSGFENPEDGKSPNLATAGFGLQIRAVQKPEVTGVDQSQKVDLPSAYITLLKKGTDEKLGTYLVSLLTERPQPVEIDGKKTEIALRFTHYYKPFRLELKDFKFDRYIGTPVAKNYSSDVKILDPELGYERELTIAMNSPLRYRGETFFQSSFTPDEKSTILQVVRNPGWILPYASCVLVSLGMLLHFSLNLGTFLNRSKKPRVNGVAAASTGSSAEWIIPAASVLLVLLYVGGSMMPRSTGGKFDLREAARLPVVKEGRVKPLDTVARVDLRLITHKEEFTDETGTKQPAIKWFFDTTSGSPQDPGVSAKYKIFRIENDQLLELLKLKHREGLRYSADEMRPRWKEFNEAALAADERPQNQLDLFESKLLELRKHIEIYLGVWLGQGKTFPLLLPPGDGKEWRTPGSVREAAFEEAKLTARKELAGLNLPANLQDLKPDQQEQVMKIFDDALAKAESRDPAYVAWQAMLTAYRSGDADAFNKRLYEYRDKFAASVSAEDRTRARFETFLNEFAPFYHCTGLYVLAFLLVAFGWVAMAFNPGVSEGLRKAAFAVLILTFVLHTFALLSRMYLMDRPLVFVTNLYSSAVFIGWAATGICLLIERWFPISIGITVASVIGFGTSVVAHNLAAGGDTLEMMQAVLDTNFWLATHVTTVTLGYSATYVAGMLGLAYVFLGVFTPVLRQTSTVQVDAQGRGKEIGRIISQVMYGVICLAMMLSFIGTVLGGIWADQSWGRFWGWDPKENGAVLIVIWNALILHARWCGLVKDRGVAVLAIVGNMVTTWSWFGTNQLGVGLHAYGFNNELVRLCMGIWLSHLGVIAMGLTPLKYWASFSNARSMG